MMRYGRGVIGRRAFVFIAALLFGVAAARAEESQFRFEAKITADPPHVTMEATADYGLVLSPGYMYKQYLQQWLNEKVKCDQPDSYTCAEYPVGRIVGASKFLMQEDPETKVWQHVARFSYVDKAGPQTVEFPIEIGRTFPAYKVGNFKLLDPQTPGAFRNEFVVSPKSFGDSLVKLVPEKNRLYGHLCQVFPGTSLLNNSFNAKYAYLPALSLALKVSGRLGGVQFDALRVCSLVKVELSGDNQVLSTVLDVMPPVTYNLTRVPLEIRVHPSSWLAVVIVILVIGILLALIPVMLVKVIGIILIIIAVLTAILGMLSSSILTDMGNRMADAEIQKQLGMPLSEFNSEVWSRKLDYEKNGKYLEQVGQEFSGDLKDGSWAGKLLTLGLLKDQHLVAQAAATISFEKYFAQLDLEKKRVRDACVEVLQVFDDAKIPAEIRAVIAPLRAELMKTCDSINDVNVKTELFLPRENSRAAGCYDAFVRLDDIQGQRQDLLMYLIDKVGKGAGEYRPQVLAVLNERLSGKVEFVKITNWWADQSGPSFCGFDNRLRIQLPRLPQSKLVACLIGELTRHPNEQAALLDGIIKNCGREIVGVLDLEELSGKLRQSGDLAEIIRKAEAALPALRSAVGERWKELGPEIEILIAQLKRRAAEK